MKIYTIATETHQTYGHGDFGTERRIVREGSYGAGEFPPAFTRRESAEAYLRKGDQYPKRVVVELELYDSTTCET